MDVAKMYDEVSDRYQKLIKESQYVGPHWVDEKLKTLDLKQVSALDLACATGSIGEVIKTHYPEANLHGLDISSKMVDKARETNFYQSVSVHNLDQPFSPIFNQTFDIITALGSLSSLPIHSRYCNASLISSMPTDAVSSVFNVTTQMEKTYREIPTVAPLYIPLTPRAKSVNSAKMQG